MLGNIGFTEIAILVLILLLFFGAKRIPEIGSSIGQGIKEFKKSLKDSSGNEEQRSLPGGSVGGGVPTDTPAGDPKRLSD